MTRRDSSSTLRSALWLTGAFILVGALIFWTGFTSILQDALWENRRDPPRPGGRPWGDRLMWVGVGLGSLSAVAVLWAGWRGKSRVAAVFAVATVASVGLWAFGVSLD